MRDTKIVERPAEQTTLTKRYTAEAVRFIEQHADEPFFLYLAHSMPHIPLFRSPPFEDISARGLYGDVIEEIDWSVGQILATLRQHNLAKRTLVIFTSDNGPWLVQRQNGGSAGPLRAGKGTTWEGGMRVPMIAWWPDHIPAGRTSHELATTLDLLPTAAALADAPLPDTELDGFNLLPTLTNDAPSPRDFFVFHRGVRPYAARWGPWKAHFFTQSAYPARARQEHNPPLLYNLEQDPEERFNVADQHPQVIAEIRQRLNRHLASVGRPNVPAIEAEALLNQTRITGGELRTQKMGDRWGGNAQLWWVNATPGDTLTLPLDAPQAGQYELVGFFTRARDYGIVRLLVHGQPVGNLLDGYADGIEPTGPVSFGRVKLKRGPNPVTIELVGKDVRAAGFSDGYLVGIDGFSLRD
jgi:arylsulfatase A